LPILCLPDFEAFEARGMAFYNANGDRLARVRNGQPSEQSLALIRAFENAGIQGSNSRRLRCFAMAGSVGPARAIAATKRNRPH
jgi:hypothetical protein